MVIGSKVLIVFVVLFILPQVAWSQTREKIRVALGSISVSSSLFPIAQQVGIFPKYGIDMEPIYFGGGMNSIAAVTSNSVQFSLPVPRQPSARGWAESISLFFPCNPTNWSTRFLSRRRSKRFKTLEAKSSLVRGREPRPIARC